jgi:diguanylate cyclase (GGDEF)-like protein
MRALQARDVSAAALVAGFHVVTASLSSVSLTMLVAYYLQAYRQLAATAGRDYLTGLVNRGKLYELLRYEMARATRQRRPLSLMFYDIDDFGLINKQHGHPIGDRVLRTFTQQVQGQLRGVDHLGRWGGEEFMAIIPDTTLEDAYYLAERVRATLSATPIPPVGIITASFGVVTWQADDTIESLLSRLDIAVRDAKWQGKNRVVIMHAPDNPDDA